MTSKHTKLVHAGRNPANFEGAVNTPVVRASTIIFPNYSAYQSAQAGTYDAITYGIYGTATRRNLEEQLAELEGMERAFLYPSGLAAITCALMALLNPGDHLLLADNVYGPTRSFADSELKRLGVEVSYFDPMLPPASIEPLFKPNTKAIYVENPGSISFEVCDIPAIAKLAHTKGAIVCADVTWVTSLYANPKAWGVDVCIQALTKYQAGYADVLMGSVTANGEIAKILDKHYRLYGLTVSSDDCYLLQRGLRSMGARLAQQEQTALTLAEWLKKRPETLKILHPAFSSCPGHDTWKRDIGHSCGLFAVVIKKQSKEALTRLFDGMKIFAMGYSWGSFESLMIHLDPTSCRTEQEWPYQDATLLRLHAGLESAADLIADLEAGFKRLAG